MTRSTSMLPCAGGNSLPAMSPSTKLDRSSRNLNTTQPADESRTDPGRGAAMSVDYEVGYKRPPPATQFKKAQSGTPRGRQRLSRNLMSDSAEELAHCSNVTA